MYSVNGILSYLMQGPLGGPGCKYLQWYVQYYKHFKILYV